jgi:hypothetical protein
VWFFLNCSDSVVYFWTVPTVWYILNCSDSVVYFVFHFMKAFSLQSRNIIYMGRRGRVRMIVEITTLCDKVCQWLVSGLWIFPDTPGTPASSTNKTDPHGITEILLKVALSTIPLTPNIYIISSSLNTIVTIKQDLFWFHLEYKKTLLCYKWIRFNVNSSYRYSLLFCRSWMNSCTTENHNEKIQKPQNILLENIQKNTWDFWCA